MNDDTPLDPKTNANITRMVDSCLAAMRDSAGGATVAVPVGHMFFLVAMADLGALATMRHALQDDEASDYAASKLAAAIEYFIQHIRGISPESLRATEPSKFCACTISLVREQYGDFNHLAGLLGAQEEEDEDA